MMTFLQFQEFNNAFRAAAHSPRTNYGPTYTQQHGSTQGFYNQAVQDIAGERVRETHVNSDNGRIFDIQYVFAKPLRDR